MHYKILFFPSTNWLKGYYSISCNIKVEDLSGNNLQRLFDQDISEKQEAPTLQRRFTID